MSEFPERVGGHLDRVLRGLGAPEADAIQAIFEHWDQIVGATLAERTRPVGIEANVLQIAADEPAVASHLRYLEAELLDRLAESLGAGRITSIQVRVRPAG